MLLLQNHWLPGALEQEIERLQSQLSTLEQELAEDWADLEKLSAFRTTRARVDRLLERWEALVEEEEPESSGASA